MLKVLGGKEKVRVAVAQTSPSYMDKEKTLRKAGNLITEAASGGAELLVFPEVWLSGYPYWIMAAMGQGDNSKFGKAITMMQDSSIQIPGEETEILCDHARKNKINLVVGCNEMSEVPGSRTLYNSLLFIGSEGKVLGRHRKLMPTHEERLIWGIGDGSDLKVFDTSVGRVSGLVCWENHMVLARAAVILKGEEFHVAVWPGSWDGNSNAYNAPDLTGQSCDLFPAIREHAFEAGSFVISASAFMNRDDISDDFPFKDSMNIEWACGGSTIVDPSGHYIAGPVFGKETILYADCHADAIKVNKAVFDSLGHYSRFDVARLDLREEPWSPFSHQKRAPSQIELDRSTEKERVESGKAERIFPETSGQN
jgi:amidase/nitrilase